ncbi:class I SAM-dependent methyltransferase [Pseudoxanthomonas sacheonensis]|uniref:class I SAM-dependent methyltransferase n=1 Tax=Pseudoxanthomonas sacheonensis TaxID=443615 RepID=UPI0013D7EF0D|nr:class I SAM-dependent methyltransferase [Pseudoxanthomonas sacheonensis]KAF1712903.1 hypothetical protein CSC73_01060 [Pseudoxanthomonas sacheonensis]
MRNEEALKRRSAWSTYWASGALHSCANSYQDNYRGAIEDFWGVVFKHMGASSRVLDIATGNGALPLMLSRLRGREAKDSIDAVDLAEIAPAWNATEQWPQIRFHSGIRMERLPFENQSFDLVVSQYGIEYGKWPDALSEGLRVCRSEGVLALVLHHSDSVLVSVGRSELRNHELLTSPRGLIESARRVIPWVSTMRAGIFSYEDAAEAQSRKAAYNLAMSVISEEIVSTPVPDLLLEARQSIHQLVSEAAVADADASQILLRLEQYSDSLAAAALRTAEMVSHALCQADMEAMKRYLIEARPDWKVTSRVILQAEGLLGWGMVAAVDGNPIHAWSASADPLAPGQLVGDDSMS